MEYIFEYEFEVRDYECDVQGIVNNANYQHYMEPRDRQVSGEMSILKGLKSLWAPFFSNSLCSLLVSVSRSGIHNSCNISNFIIIVFVMVICDQ